MQNLHKEVNSFDQRCYDTFGLSEDLLMEHAADGIADFIKQHFASLSSVHIVCGAGNNGADGIVLGRLLQGYFDVTLSLPYEAKSKMCKLQFKRAKKIKLRFLKAIPPQAEILVDALFGSGFSRGFDAELSTLLKVMNNHKAIKIACDIPSGIFPDGRIEKECFTAQHTLTMGALKLAMYSDAAKEKVGEITVLDLGISRDLYEDTSLWKVLDKEDMQLPVRNRQNSHKGSYGHLCVICGEKTGAATISGLSALNSGCGLVTLMTNHAIEIPFALMQSNALPATSTAIAVGMGLGNSYSDADIKALTLQNLPLLMDADLFHRAIITTLLTKSCIITPHPREFVALLNQCALAEITVAELQERRFEYVELFCKKYPKVVLLLKGANMIIGNRRNYYINPHGSNTLAKGGSGDVLSGIIASLLAQGSAPLDAAINGSLMLCSSAARFDGNNYALTPDDLISGLKRL